MIKSNNQGQCPYCNGKDIIPSTEGKDPRRTVCKCNSCNKYCVKSNITGKIHPIENPEDSSSFPMINKK